MTIENITKTYPGVRALSDVSMMLDAGQVHGVVGENGAGKSTLMGVISGAVVPDSGTVQLDGEPMPAGNPKASRSAGVAIVRQEPALLPDLTIAENIYLGIPEGVRPSPLTMNRAAAEMLAQWSADLRLDPTTRVDELAPEHRFIVEITRAIASRPRVLILDEPTEHLAGEDVDRLFEQIRRLTGTGVAVVYISHRIAEVKQIADRLTVLRNGAAVGTYDAADLEERDVINLIVGRELDETFPPKRGTRAETEPRLRVSELSGGRFRNVTFDVAPGEIIGFAGIDGNGQRETLRALAGLLPSSGTVELGGRRVSTQSTSQTGRDKIAYIASDRHREGIFSGLSVRENIAVRNLSQFVRGGFLSSRSESRTTAGLSSQFNVRTSSLENPIDSLSGGNQQKAVLAGALGANPDLLLLDEPTQGVDVGARSEIYGIIRERAERTGMSVVLHSTDARELAGIADRVLVFSRGKVVAQLSGDEVSEDSITSAALSSTETREKARTGSHPALRWFSGDVAPPVIVGVAIVALSLITQLSNPFFLGGPSVASILTLATTLAIAAMAQTIVMLVGGIDLSIGPLMGLLVVVQSFFLVDGTSSSSQLLGWVLWIVIPLAVGLVNWALIDLVKVHPMIATLVTFTALQAISLMLRPTPGGAISRRVTSAISASVGPLPIAFLLVVVAAVVLTWVLMRTRVGVVLRGTGSDDGTARLNAIKPATVRLLAYVAASLMAAIGSLPLMAQLGSGDPAGGTSYTLASIAAAVIGGAALAGGRGTFVGALLGALLLQIANSVTTFLGLNTAWQSFLVGGLTIVAVAGYSRSRHLVSIGARS
ncbi:ATP-binding cassette domain-containing protein [Microbacterium sp. RD1]|uniref:ATP-binding cassette domain-containing protein n=1 Tax=Microbacterium sp. RD1 TaxID=3457313 RepID=UPI003FA58D4A